MLDLPPEWTNTVAVVDDDASLREALARYLESRGCIVHVAGSGRELDEVLSRTIVDVVVLDLLMPGEDGLTICRRLSEDQPIIMLSALADASDRIIGLELGAHDYLAKPFDPRELLARINSLARRARTAQARGERHLFAFDGWLLDVGAKLLTAADGAIVPLTGHEFSLLHAFLKRPRKTLTREVLLTETHGHDCDVFDRAMDVTISRLRRKLTREGGSSLIETVRGEGYRFTPLVKRR